MQRYFRLLNVVAGVIVLGAMFLGGGGLVQAAHHQPSASGRVSVPRIPAYKYKDGYGKDHIPWNIFTGLGNFDPNGGGKTDYAVYGLTYPPETGSWQVCYSSEYKRGDPKWKDPPPAGCRHSLIWGQPDDIPMPGKYGNGQQTTNYALWRPTDETWHIRYSDGSQQTVDLKDINKDLTPEQDDIPVPYDYEGIDQTDYAVYRPSTGKWYIRYSDGSQQTVDLKDINKDLTPEQDDIPVPGKYDSGGIKADYAVYRPSTAMWYVGYSDGSQHWLKLGQPGNNDIPVPDDYAVGGYTDFAVWQRSTGTWSVCYILTQQDSEKYPNYVPDKNECSGTPHTLTLGGKQGDIPVPGNYNGDHADFAVYRPTDDVTAQTDNGAWYICNNEDSCPLKEQGDTNQVRRVQWGATTFIPI